MMDYVRFDDVTEGMMNNADDETIDTFLSVASKVAKILRVKVDNLIILPDVDPYLVSVGKQIPTRQISSKLFDNGDYVVEVTESNSYWLYFRSEQDAEKFINSDNDNLEEELLDESTKEEVVHDFMSARRLAKKYGGRITGPITNENGLKVYKVRYTENLKEDVNEDDYWERQRDKYWDSKDYDYPDYDTLVRDNEKELFRELVLSDLSNRESILDYIAWYDEDNPDEEYMYNIKDYSYEQLVEEIVKWYNDFDTLVDYLDEDKKDIVKYYADSHGLVVNESLHEDVDTDCCTKVNIKKVKKGEYFTMKPIAEPKESQVWVRGDYDKENKAYECQRFNDMNDYKYIKSDKDVYVGFTF